MFQVAPALTCLLLLLLGFYNEPPPYPFKRTQHVATALITFGQRLPDGSLKRATEIEWKPGTKYGWDVLIASPRPSLTLKEVLTLPGPATWGNLDKNNDGPLSSSTSSVSKNGEEFIKEVRIKTSEPVQYSQTFEIIPGDPKGKHRLRLYLEGELAVDLDFYLK